ncbi:DUF4383 domain-containing protein [Streptomonospora sp. PA3]|uniref:DUF4383 domain-containing protein n=1 Tax=Streptomonospora sp. PA3 TaxID=2607326 RepID=UPI0012DDE6A5|nr:DUF4383 domain-containing protein [Streptomonospora sp. PA3]MUL41113.1 DUF4383 domain-containing protein [Streptomonospora sp. PA3]
MSRPTQATVPDATRGAARVVAGLVGGVFLLVGVLGFVPITTGQYGTLEWAGPDSHAMLLGLFQVSVLHNIVHLVFGAAGLAAAFLPAMARAYLLVSGVLYLGLWIYGMVVPPDSAANFVPVNAPDNWLHLILGIGLVGAGFVVKRGRGDTP